MRNLGAALAALALCAPPLLAQGQQTPPKLPQVPLIRANSTLVDVPVLVLDKKGQPVDSLSQEDFQVSDDGVRQRLSGFDNQPRPISLAIVVDTSDWDAIDQAKRAAETINSMVVGAKGEASIFIPGPEPKQLVPFTSDGDVLVNQLKHLQKSPTGPQGEGAITEPLNLAMLDLRHQPSDHTRAALVISHSSARSGVGAEALLEGAMSDAIPIFHLTPNRPANAPVHNNPDTPAERGTGQGSQRVQAPPAPVDSHGMPTSNPGMGNLDLGPIISGTVGLAGKVFAPHHMDYVYNSGGVTYSAGNDSDFDRKLSLIGDELRTVYHLYYSPSDLANTMPRHTISVQLALPATADVGNITYRRTYLGIVRH